MFTRQSRVKSLFASCRVRQEMAERRQRNSSQGSEDFTMSPAAVTHSHHQHKDDRQLWFHKRWQCSGPRLHLWRAWFPRLGGGGGWRRPREGSLWWVSDHVACGGGGSVAVGRAWAGAGRFCGASAPVPPCGPSWGLRGGPALGGLCRQDSVDVALGGLGVLLCSPAGSCLGEACSCLWIQHYGGRLVFCGVSGCPGDPHQDPPVCFGLQGSVQLDSSTS